jgi:hypothetical protein
MARRKPVQTPFRTGSRRHQTVAGKRRNKAVAKAEPASPKRRRKAIAKAEPASPKRRRKAIAKAGGLTITEVARLDDLRRELERAAGRSPLRWNADPDEVQRSVAQLVLTLVEFIRKLLERQAIRRMEGGTLTDQQTEDIGRALMTLEATVRDLAARFGIPAEDLNLDLGPVGKLI